MRNVSSWLDSFVELTKTRHSPENFRLWSAASAVASGLQRKVHCRIMGRELYPNLFILLVADPGVGKSNAIFSARDIITRDKRIKMAPQRITKEAFYMVLEESAANLIIPGEAIQTHHSLSAFIDEFGVFVRRGDLDFMADLADLYDCPTRFQYRTKHQVSQDLAKAWFNFISGCTPAWVKESFTEIALEQGFPARIIAVYGSQKSIPDLWSTGTEDTDNDKLRDVLVEDFAEICELRGEFIWQSEAARMFQSWVSDGMKPFPQDPRLRHYCTRRIMHVAKLSMVVSASESNELVITLEHFRRARDILMGAELEMHKAYAVVGKNPYFAAVEGVLRYAIAEYRRTKQPVMENTLRRVLEREVPYNLVLQIIDQVVATGRLKTLGEPPNRFFTPGDAPDDAA